LRISNTQNLLEALPLSSGSTIYCWRGWRGGGGSEAAGRSEAKGKKELGCEKARCEGWSEGWSEAKARLLKEPPNSCLLLVVVRGLACASFRPIPLLLSSFHIYNYIRRCQASYSNHHKRDTSLFSLSLLSLLDPKMA